MQRREDSPSPASASSSTVFFWLRHSGDALRLLRAATEPFDGDDPFAQLGIARVRACRTLYQENVHEHHPIESARYVFRNENRLRGRTDGENGGPGDLSARDMIRFKVPAKTAVVSR